MKERSVTLHSHLSLLLQSRLVLSIAPGPKPKAPNPKLTGVNNKKKPYSIFQNSLPTLNLKPSTVNPRL